MNPEKTFSFPTELESIFIGDECFRLLHAADVDSLFDRLRSLPDDHPAVKDEQIPYWAEVWPSAIGLSEYLINHCDLLADCTVLEIGCGLGLPGIVAGKFARRVVLSDYLEDPVRLAEENWKLNHGTTAASTLLDWRTGNVEEKVDVLLASDVAYERRMFEPLLDCFRRLIKPNGTVLVSEPDRHFAREFFSQLELHGWDVETETRYVERLGMKYRINVHALKS